MRVLDAGANDGWMLANLWLGREDLGIDFEELSGIELNADAAKRAKERQGKHGWPGKIVHGNIFEAPEHFEPHSFDAVSNFEVIEHVPDPGQLLDLLASMVKPGGRVYVSTPEGAFERGAIPDWARVESKGHLRAMTPHELCSLLCARGVVENFDLDQRLQVASLRPEPRKGKIVFYAGASEALPEQVLTTGLGGSETALCKMAEHFARRGYDVRVYAGMNDGGLRGDQITVDGKDEIRGQVLYAPFTRWDPGEEADLFVSVRQPEAFDQTINAPRRALWLHDADYGNRLTELRASRATDVIVLSDFQRELLAGLYPFLTEHDGYRVSRNGIETSFYAPELPEKEPIVVYSSSPDRGLDVLLECWPQIREQVPEAELHFGYSPFYFQVKDAYPHLQAFHRRIEELMEGQEGLQPFGSLGQEQLAALFRRAKVWAYPSWTSPSNEPFPEISCISAMEAQAAGAIPVCADFGALRETVQPSEWRLEPEIADGKLTDRWRKEFVSHIVRALRTGEADPAWREWALGQDWSGVADEWERVFLAPERQAVAA